MEEFSFTRAAIRRQLQELVDESYRKFSQKLIPECKNILGVRLPLLRKLARRIARADWEKYLQMAGDDSLEETSLQGLVIGYITVPIQTRLTLIEKFVSKIDNWGTNDTFCGTLKFRREEGPDVWKFLQFYLGDSRPFFLRFGMVMLLKFIDGEHIDDIFTLLVKINSDNRYVKLAAAWLIAECCVHFPAKTMEFLAVEGLDRWTKNKAIQKITESLRIDRAIKTKLRGP
jgi:3-methyladenine DNA glycosylase AlkD